MKIGYAQFAPALGDVDGNLEKIDELLKQCRGAHLVVLPELCSTGYNFESAEQAMALSETWEQSRLIELLADHCREDRLYIVGGFCEREGDLLYNSAALVGPEGPLGRYRKMHLFWNEKDIFQPGNLGLPIFELGGAKVGMLICFDWQFPEIWRILALKGADIVCLPSNLVLPGLAQRAVPLHAMLNRIFIVLANRYGSEGELTFTGRSIVSDPRGNLISEATAAEDSVSIVEIDPAAARDKAVTPRNDLIADRRPEEYVELISQD